MSELALLGNMPEILQIEEYLKTLPQTECPITEYKIDGVYVRSMFIPKDTLLTGKIHLNENIAILAQGTIKICNGKDSYEISAPYIMIDPGGTKRLGYAVTDVTFITVHKYYGENPEKDLVCNSFDEYEQKKIEVENILGRLQ